MEKAVVLPDANLALDFAATGHEAKSVPIKKRHSQRYCFTEVKTGTSTTTAAIFDVRVYVLTRRFDMGTLGKW